MIQRNNLVLIRWESLVCMSNTLRFWSGSGASSGFMAVKMKAAAEHDLDISITAKKWGRGQESYIDSIDVLMIG